MPGPPVFVYIMYRSANFEMRVINLAVPNGNGFIFIWHFSNFPTKDNEKQYNQAVRTMKTGSFLFALVLFV